MQLLAPMMMIGAAAVAVPIALHFFYRARYKPLPWAPMKFLKEAIEQTSRRLKFQEWILLALRCLAIVLLALAIARPGFDTASVAGRGDAIDAVFLFDTSMSMGADDGEGKSRLDRAKAAALDVLKTLPQNSTIQIYTCSDRATLVGPKVASNTDEAEHLIPKIELSSLPSDLLPGLNDALSAAKRGTSPAKEIYVFTDVQKEAFERQQGAVKSKCEEIKRDANLVFVRCGNPQRKIPNVAVTDVTWISDIPHTRTRVPFVITLKNTGNEPVKGIKVSLEIDGKAVEKDAVQVDQIDPGQTYPVTLTGGLDTPGVRVVGVAITGDSLPGDDVFYKTILVRDKVRVLLVDGTPKPENPTGAGDHFVKTALNPGRIRDYYIETESVSATEASVKDLEDRDIVYLLNAPIRGPDPVVGMSAEFLAELTRFVKAGGGLIVTGGDLVSTDEYNKRLGSGGAGLLPFDIQGVRTTTETSPFYPAAEKVEETSFLGAFRRQPFADALQRVALFSMLDLKEPGPGRVLARTTDGKPYIASKTVEGGEVIQIAGSLDETWGNFSSDPGSFHVPLAVFTVTHLTGRKEAGGTAIAGNALVWFPAPDAGTAFELVKPPANDREKLRPRTKLEAADPNVEPRRSVTTADTARAGVYHIVPLGKADDAGPVFTVNPDLRESANMAVATNDEVEKYLGFAPAMVQAGADTEAAVTSLRTQSEWTEYVLVFLLVLLVAEAAWAWVCGRAW